MPPKKNLPRGREGHPTTKAQQTRPPEAQQVLPKSFFSITLPSLQEVGGGRNAKARLAASSSHLPAASSPRHRVDCGCSETRRRPGARPDRQNGLPARLGARPVAGRSWLVLTWAEARVSFYPHLSLQHRKPAARGSRWALKQNKPGSGGIRADEARDQPPRGKKLGVAEVAE